MNKQFKLFFIMLFFINNVGFSQSDFDKALKSGEIIINGLSILKSSKTETKTSNPKIVENVCIKNKLAEKITFSMVGKDDQDNVVKKEMVIQKDGKECIFELPKGIYTYEIILPNKEIYKKGEYKFIEDTTITVKAE
ncbi:MAG: hypothetical protein DCE86_08340 [Flavobacteriaceae bacterium]|uniref:hypothetical protein n=1 Tax=Flavobacterium sp. Leaf359 TaxID=1736351 RepID=UPI00070070E8|nr:hypothetical protein [Flavobacterium sp. Leaf359]KQS49991.1 hypothetical protein ASG38_03160 [Flavobacterium sp. Leaf359]PZO31994.1 MAG: hypothetical protein DCE86_08340 [Flavobacteriaceae bacterium]